MIEISQSEYNRLFLLKEDKNEIFLNNCHLIKQHQIDGLRFLFKQFQKKKPVAVVNFPEECGKSVTVALFLSAINSLLKKPVLIICSNENEIEYWKEIILKWSDFNIDDIAIEPSNVFIKKKIFLKTSPDLVSYQRPNWSIVITKKLTKSMLKLTFNADLKIWITSTDVKKDVTTLACFYNWCLPITKTKPSMNPNDFIPRGKQMKEKLEKAILLDSYIEDFVIQEARIEPFTKKRNSNTPIADTSGGKEKTAQQLRKNKDATGTKIKRSRRILDDDIVIESKENVVSINNNDESQNIVLHFDAESLIHNDNDNGYADNANNRIECLGNSKKYVEINKHSSEMIYERIESQSICLDYDKIENNMEVYEENIKDGVKSQTHNTSIQDDEIVEIHTEENKAETHASDKEKINLDTNSADDKEIETDSIKESPKDIDISEWEAKALKKFKGSLLDTIF